MAIPQGTSTQHRVCAYYRDGTDGDSVQVGISVNLIFLVVGLVVSSAVPPLAFLLTWRKVPRGAAITGALAGQAAGIIAWLVHTQVVYGAITQDTSQVNPWTCHLHCNAINHPSPVGLVCSA